MEVYTPPASPDNLRNIGLQLSLPDILHLCNTNKEWERHICQYPDFWRSLLLRDYPDVDLSRKKQNVSYMDLYIELYRNIGWWYIYRRRGCRMTKVTSDVKQIIAEYKTIFILDRSGRLWGSGSAFGEDTPCNHSGFVEIDLPPDAAEIKQMDNYGTTLYILDINGRIWAMNSYTNRAPIPFDRRETNEGRWWYPSTQPGNITSVHCGGRFVIVTRNDGTVWGNGYSNYGGVLGRNYSVGDGYQQISEITMDIEKIACGMNHMMIIDKTGRLWGMGYNNRGQLGTNNVPLRSYTPIELSENIRDVSCGVVSTTVLDNAGVVYVTGSLSITPQAYKTTVFTPVFQNAIYISARLSSITVVDEEHRAFEIGPIDMTPRHITDLFGYAAVNTNAMTVFYGIPTAKLGVFG